MSSTLIRCKNRSRYRRCVSAMLFCALPILSGCKSITSTPSVVADSGQRWALLPIENLSVTPLAGERASNMIETQLRRRGVALLANYSDAAANVQQDLSTLLNSKAEISKAQQWARSNGYRYAVTGSVNEWHYKTGTDKEPAVGLNLKVIDLPTGMVIWQATGSRTGWGYSNLARIGEKVTNDLVSEMSIKRQSVVNTPTLGAALPGTQFDPQAAKGASLPKLQPRGLTPAAEPSLGAATAGTAAAGTASESLSKLSITDLPRLQMPRASATSRGEIVELNDPLSSDTLPGALPGTGSITPAMTPATPPANPLPRLQIPGIPGIPGMGNPSAAVEPLLNQPASQVAASAEQPAEELAQEAEVIVLSSGNTGVAGVPVQPEPETGNVAAALNPAPASAVPGLAPVLELPAQQTTEPLVPEPVRTGAAVAPDALVPAVATPATDTSETDMLSTLYSPGNVVEVTQEMLDRQKAQQNSQ